MDGGRAELDVEEGWVDADEAIHCLGAVAPPAEATGDVVTTALR
jgi:hypothetical protein